MSSKNSDIIHSSGIEREIKMSRCGNYSTAMLYDALNIICLCEFPTIMYYRIVMNYYLAIGKS